VTIKDQIEKVAAALADWHKSVGGAVKIANDEPHLFQILGDMPGAVRSAILFDEEMPRSLDLADVLGRVDRKLIVAVSRGRGFNLNQGDSLTKGVADGKPMFVLIEEAREVLRALRFPEQDEPVPTYLGTKRLQFQGVTCDAYAITLGLAADIGDQTDPDPENE
jgi:hypothetical protein